MTLIQKTKEKNATCSWFECPHCKKLKLYSASNDRKFGRTRDVVKTRAVILSVSIDSGVLLNFHELVDKLPVLLITLSQLATKLLSWGERLCSILNPCRAARNSAAGRYTLPFKLCVARKVWFLSRFWSKKNGCEFYYFGLKITWLVCRETTWTMSTWREETDLDHSQLQ